MDSAEKLQKRLDQVFQNGALFTQELSSGSVTTIASRAWALREHENGVLVAIIFATNLRRWIHLVTEVQINGGFLTLRALNTGLVNLHPLNPNFVRPDILEKAKNESRTKEQIEANLDAFLEGNPHIVVERL